MTTPESTLIETAKRYTAICVQVSQAYNAEQAKLKLDKVLTYDRLSSATGTRISLDAIDQLATLTSMHKAAMEKIFNACTTDSANALSALAEDKQIEYRDSVVKALLGHLAAQSQLYESRGKWIDAARKTCELVDAHRDTARCEGETETISFADGSDQDRFESLLADVDETHRLEVVLTKQMLDRFTQSSALLGLSAQ